MDLDTGLLRAFGVLATELHFGRTASALGITQQALSKRINRLENELAVSLVDRSDRRSVRLTTAGRHLLPLAREVVAAVDRLAPDAARSSDRLRVDVMGDYLAPTGWLRRASGASGLPLDAVQRPADAAADHLLTSGRAHFAFGRAGAVPTPWPSGIHRRLVLLEPLAVLAPRAHPWAGLDRLPIGALAGQTLWFPLSAAPAEWRSYLAEFAAFTGVTIDPTGSTFGYAQWAEDVSSGHAPPSLIGEAMTPPDPNMRVVPIVDPTPVFPWSLLWREDVGDAVAEELLAAMGFAVKSSFSRRDSWMPASDAELPAAR
ncbi:LysR family transcriptional regulator [Microbacteriaceae bacterium 4G12]